MSNSHGFRIHLMWREIDIIQTVNNLFDIKLKNGILNLKRYLIAPAHLSRGHFHKFIEKPLFFLGLQTSGMISTA
jgi:hypothetical protein